jgi:iron complex outermembrane receptor protein
LQEGIAPEDQETEDDAVTGTLKYQYQFNDDLMGYASYDRGWRGGTSNIAGAPQPPAFGLFDAEESDNIELGFKWSLMGGRGLWNMAIFYQTYTDFQYLAEVAYRDAEAGVSIETPVVNVDEAEVYGFDTDVTYLLSEVWTLSAALSYNKTELSDAKDVPCINGEPGSDVWDFNTCDLTGDRAGNLPEWSVNLFTEYSIPSDSGNSDWYGRALLNWESEYYSNTEQANLESYATLDLFLGWRTASRSWDAQVWAKNIFDETAELDNEALPPVPDYDNPAGGQLVTGYTWVRNQLNPRTIGLTVSYNF